ncbi:DUF6631 family protein [Rhodanobacter lindaniclasticus]
MARKLDKTASSRPKRKADAPAAGADDLAALHPDAQATLGGRVVVIKEYRFVTGQHVRAKALPFTQALDAQIKRGSALTEDILDVLAQHADLVRELMLDAIVDFDQYKTADEWLEACEDWRGWMKGLNDADGEALLLRWWEVCGLFFCARSYGGSTRRRSSTITSRNGSPLGRRLRLPHRSRSRRRRPPRAHPHRAATEPDVRGGAAPAARGARRLHRGRGHRLRGLPQHRRPTGHADFHRAPAQELSNG